MEEGNPSPPQLVLAPSRRMQGPRQLASRHVLYLKLIRLANLTPDPCDRLADQPWRHVEGGAGGLGDLDEDGAIDGNDLALLLGAWTG